MDPRKWRIRKAEGWWWVIPPWSDSVAYRTPWFDQAIPMAHRKHGLRARHVPHTPATTPLPPEVRVQCLIDEAAYLQGVNV